MSTTVSNNSKVTLQFEIRLDSGEVVDSTFEKAPATFVMGDGSLFTGFERRLIGMAAGQRATYQIPPEDAFGQPNPSNVQTFKRSQFDKDMDIVPGMMFSFADAQNTELPGVVKEVSETFVDVDFNHPLAGKTLDFEVLIHAVEEA
jgi:FKBP-type peptidyl-prolyl cis-trans isomerase SlpA